MWWVVLMKRIWIQKLIWKRVWKICLENKKKLFSLAADGWGPPARTTSFLQPPRPRVSLGWKLPRPKLPRPRSPPSPALRSLEEPPRASRLTSPHFPLSPLGLLPIASAQKTVAGVLRPPREASFQSRFRSDLAPWWASSPFPLSPHPFPEQNGVFYRSGRARRPWRSSSGASQSVPRPGTHSPRPPLPPCANRFENRGP